MRDKSIIPNTTGSFPDVASVNASGESTYDGTPLLKIDKDDEWGYVQALLYEAGLTPDGVVEAPGTSQILEAIRKISGAPGELVMWLGADIDPASLGLRIIPLTGQTIEIASYSALAEAVYVGDSANATAPGFYKVDAPAGSRDISGGYMVLPDYRGMFVRGWSDSNTWDYQGVIRSTPGTYWHGFRQADEVSNDTVLRVFDVDSGVSLQYQGVGVTSGGTGILALVYSGGTPIGAQGWGSSHETHPLNTTALICVRY